MDELSSWVYFLSASQAV
jgi:hypothetical protein